MAMTAPPAELASGPPLAKHPAELIEPFESGDPVNPMKSMSSPSNDVWPVFKPTLLPMENFNAQADARAIGEMDKDALVEFLCKRTASQRQEMAAEHGDLNSVVRSRFHGDSEDLMIELIQPRGGDDAFWIKKAVSGIGVDEMLLHEILCTRTNEQIKEFSAAYQDRYGEPLAERLRRDCSGKHKELILHLLDADRPLRSMNEGNAREDARRLWDAGEARTIGVDEATFLDIFEHRSWHQLVAIAEEFNRIGNRDIVSSIKHQFNKAVDLPSTKKCGSALSAIMEFALNPGRFWAERLHRASSGIGTDESTIYRIFASRAEIDLGATSIEYGQIYGKTLRHLITEKFSGKAQAALLMLLGAPEE